VTAPFKQHLIDPEICIRCYTCEMSCPEEAIEHNDDNVIVDASKCNFCMDCIPVCPTGSIDEWRVVASKDDAYSLEDQYSWEELPDQEEIATNDTPAGEDDPIAALLAEAHKGAGGKAKAPATAAKPTVNLYNLGHPVEAVVQGNYRLTADTSDADTRHIILDFQGKPFPILEGQSMGIIAPGTDAGYHNVSLTVKREEGGVCSNFMCDLKKGDTINVTGPFGGTFLLPSDPSARLLMICTGTGSAPMRSFTMARQREVGAKEGGMVMFFGARTPDSLPYFGPLNKIPETLLEKHLVFSRVEGQPKEYVQDRLISEEDRVAEMLQDPNTYIYICGLKEMEDGVERAFTSIAESIGEPWSALRDTMREDGRYHVETY
jgi:benzoyl-CoA 2,3-dioxygenase component A